MALTVPFNLEDTAGNECDAGWTEEIVLLKAKLATVVASFRSHEGRPERVQRGRALLRAQLGHTLVHAAASNADGFKVTNSTFTMISPASRS